MDSGLAAGVYPRPYFHMANFAPGSRKRASASSVFRARPLSSSSSPHSWVRCLLRRRRRIRPPWTSAPAPPRPWTPTPTATWTPRPGPPPPSTPPPGPHPPSTPPSPRSWQARVQVVRIRGRLSLSSNTPSAKRRLLSTGARTTTSTTEEGSPSHRTPSCSRQRKGLNQMVPDGIIDIY